MSQPVKIGDLVVLNEPAQPWRVVYVDETRGFVRLERAGEAWVKSRVVGLGDLQHYVELDQTL